MRETWVRSLVWEDTHTAEQLNPMYHNYWACFLKPLHPRAHVPQQEKPAQWEVRASQLGSSPWPLQLEKSWHSNEDPAQLKIYIDKFWLKKKKKILWLVYGTQGVEWSLGHFHGVVANCWVTYVCLAHIIVLLAFQWALSLHSKEAVENFLHLQLYVPRFCLGPCLSGLLAMAIPYHEYLK